MRATTVTSIYTLCEECTHTTNIHNETGCRAHLCNCKVPIVVTKKEK